MAIVTVSRQLGSLGTDVAHRLAEKLRYQCLDKETFDQSLNEHGIAAAKVEKYDEKKPSLWDTFSTDRDLYLHFMKTVIYESARQGNVVILGRGGQVLLRGLPGTLSVRIIAPLEYRIKRVQDKFQLQRKEAEQAVRNSDRDRSGFHRFFFNVSWSDAWLYDLVLNTETLTVESAVDMINRTMRYAEIGDRLDEAKVVLGNLTLNQRVEAAILYEKKIPVQYFEVSSEDGIVTLRGAVTSTYIIGLCEETARATPGVKDVINEISLINYYEMM
jgi:cytidylate kinase